MFAVYSGGGATSNIAASINGDGSATFAGNLENTGYMFNINPSDSYAGIYLYQVSGGDLTRAALQISSTTSDADTTATINYDGSATFAGNVQGAYFTGVQDSANSAVFRGTYTGSPNAFNTVIYGDGSATFAGGLSSTAITCNHPSSLAGQTISSWSDQAGGSITFSSGGSAAFAGPITDPFTLEINSEYHIC